MASESTSPIPIARLSDIANDACDATLDSATNYEHASTESWNTKIINGILQNLVGETSTSGQPPAYKFAVNSTIVQHSSDPALSPSSTDAAETNGVNDLGKRGLHSAAGAFWNSEKDGMWNFKYSKAERKGFDVVISVIWISLV